MLPFQCTGKNLVLGLQRPICNAMFATNSHPLLWHWIGHFALRGLFLTFKRHPFGQITSKFPSSSGIRFNDVGRQEFCELEIHRYRLIYVITVSVNSICWIMIRARKAVFTHSDHSCRSRFWLISATGAPGCLGGNWIWKGLLKKGLQGVQGNEWRQPAKEGLGLGWRGRWSERQ